MNTAASDGPMPTRPDIGHGTDHVRQSRAELLVRYRAYRRRQARGLLHLVPREGVRPMYRRALASGYDEEGASDPMEALLAYCEDLLPLPPFEIWLDDLRGSPEAHLQDVGDSAEAPSADAPVTVATREFSFDRGPWAAHLRSFRDGATWRGFISFEDRETGRVHRTALIFSESAPLDVRDRFMSFEAFALAAFLRSALP